ncbi:hypothetical protein ACIP5Y_07495 [Nocardia sp. NPDC088792]|uniref:hypothetical protein n=1 Tax=Nocardia sp. NPDC088792 TaxID=3364332 RepID=UPI003814877F
MMTTPVEADPMPTTGRYTDTMLDWMDAFYGWHFPEQRDLVDPDNAAVLDEFVCWAGQCFLRRAGAIWVNDIDGPRIGDSAFSPAVIYRFAPEMLPDNMVELIVAPAYDILEDDDPGFPTLWALDRILQARAANYDYKTSHPDSAFAERAHDTDRLRDEVQNDYR